jgi:hypothetical protein
VATLLGLNDLQALATIADKDSLPIRCCAGSADEIADAHAALSGSAGIVIDFVALATLMFLDRLDILKTSPVQVTVAQSTVDALQQTSHYGRPDLRIEGRAFANVGAIDRNN